MPSFEITHFAALIYCFQALNFSNIQLLQIKNLLILIVSGTNWFEVRLSTNLNPFEF